MPKLYADVRWPFETRQDVRSSRRACGKTVASAHLNAVKTIQPPCAGFPNGYLKSRNLAVEVGWRHPAATGALRRPLAVLPTGPR